MFLGDAETNHRLKDPLLVQATLQHPDLTACWRSVMTFHSPLGRSATAALFLVAISSGCTSKGSDGPTTTAGSIALSLSVTSATIVQGGSTAAVGTVTRSGGFTGDVVLTVEGVPTGVTGSISNQSTVGTVTTATITILVGAAVVPGTYTLTVRGTGSGVTSVTGAFSLTVTAGASYSISLAPAALSIAQGANAPTTVTLTRTNFTAVVLLTLEGAPVGVTGAFAPLVGTGTTSTLTITVGPAVAAGVYPLTVRGTSAGLASAQSSTLNAIADQTATLTLTVTALPASYTLVLTPTTLSAAQGTSPAVAVTLTRTNVPGGIALNLEGAPTGVTGVFSPTPATGGTSTLAITILPSTAPGVYTLTVRGTTTGLADRTATITLTVTTARLNGKIAFKALNDAIFVVNADGTGITQLTPGYPNGSACTAGDEEPRFSPDGSKILFTRTQNGSQEVWTMKADGSSQTKLTSTGNGLCEDVAPDYAQVTLSENASWSPDGTKILFTSKRTIGLAKEELWIMNADGSNQTMLFAKPGYEVSEGVFSPDGTTIAFHAVVFVPGGNGCDGFFGGGEVWLMNADGTNSRRLTPPTVNCNYDENPAWSPDGRKIAYSHVPFAPGTIGDVFIINVDGTGNMNLTSAFVGEESERPAFSPDGTKIVFANGSGDSIWIMRVDGTVKTPLINGTPANAGHPNWQTVFSSSQATTSRKP